MQFPPVDQQLPVIRRGIDRIVPEAELAGKLEHSRNSGTPLRVKYGIDPTAADVHLGHTVPLRKMRQFQKLGHKVVIIIGNYTAMVGDPSGRDKARERRLSADEVEQNAEYYLGQVAKVVDLDTAEVHRNGDWFGHMTFADVLNLCSKVTVAQLLAREDFATRYREEKPVFVHECLYPIMQAWDSVQIRADIELGGTEQLYTFMLARDLQRDQNLPQQIGIMSPILVGTDGVRRMGKSLGNYIGISESPWEMMKKLMQLSDDCMRQYFELLSDIPAGDIEHILSGHPKQAKKTLARTIIDDYHDVAAAADADARWEREISQKELPSEIPLVQIERAKLDEQGVLPAAQLLKLAGLCRSTSEARRVIVQGGASTGAERTKIWSHDQPIRVSTGLMLWVGKKRFCRVEVRQ